MNKNSNLSKKPKNDKKEKLKKTPEINLPEVTTIYEFYEVSQPPIWIECLNYMETPCPSINQHLTNSFCNCDLFRNNNMVNEPFIEEPDSDNEILSDVNLPKSISTPDIRHKLPKKK